MLFRYSTQVLIRHLRPLIFLYWYLLCASPARSFTISRGEYHYTVDLLFDWFGLVCIANKNINCQFSYSWFQTSQTGGQPYSDTSHFSIFWCRYWEFVKFEFAISPSLHYQFYSTNDFLWPYSLPVPVVAGLEPPNLNWRGECYTTVLLPLAL
jgi:hypothetical protein